MTTFFVTRHAGAKEWAESEGFAPDQVLDHLDLGLVRTGDRVIGTLPVNLAAEVCAKGGHYLHLILELSKEMRGRELSASDMRDQGARVEEYHIEAIGN